MSVVQGPQKVSHIAQLETATNWAKSKDYEIVGTFEDLGVSAEKRPEDRPDLGPWLTDEGATRWDVIVWSKMDRAFRSTAHCVDFARWAEARNKVVAFADDGLTLDYSPKAQGSVKGIDEMMSELFVYLGSFFAQMELNRFKARAQDAHRAIRGMDRWASGVPPLGFQVIDHRAHTPECLADAMRDCQCPPSGKGKGLGTDPVGKALLQSIATRLLDGWSFIRIAAWLNEPYADPRCGRKHVVGCECRESAALTNMDRARIAKGDPLPKSRRKERPDGRVPERRPWAVHVVRDAMTSPRTQGFKMTGRGKHAKIVLDSEGEPIRLGPPTFDHDTWTQVQAAAELRKQGQRTRTNTVNPVLGIAFCGCTGCSACGDTGEGICGASLCQQTTRKPLASGEIGEWRFYRCARTPRNCNGVGARADELEFQLAHEFAYLRGREPMTRRVFVPGEDHSAELEQVNATIERLRLESDSGLLTTPEDERLWLERMKTQVAKRDLLASMPSRSAGWVTEETDQTKLDAWCDTDDLGRRQLLIDAGIRFILCHKDAERRGYFIDRPERPAVSLTDHEVIDVSRSR